MLRRRHGPTLSLPGRLFCFASLTPRECPFETTLIGMHVSFYMLAILCTVGHQGGMDTLDARRVYFTRSACFRSVARQKKADFVFAFPVESKQSAIFSSCHARLLFRARDVTWISWEVQTKVYGVPRKFHNSTFRPTRAVQRRWRRYFSA